jgi:hypothetical protein
MSFHNVEVLPLPLTLAAQLIQLPQPPPRQPLQKALLQLQQPLDSYLSVLPRLIVYLADSEIIVHRNSKVSLADKLAT